MITHTMSQVETLTGISAHALRVWERRYNYLIPERTPTNIRFYTEDQLKTLLNVSILLQHGYKISKIVKLEENEMFDLVTNFLLSSSEKDHSRINGLVLCMLNMDEATFNKIYNRSVSEVGFITTIMHLIYPFLNLVGGLWITNKAIPAQEHFISNLIRQKIISAIDQLPSPPQDGKKILLYLLEGESHEIGLLMANYMAKSLAWNVFYLGQNVPSKNIKNICSIGAPDLMLTMFTTPKKKNITSIIANIMKDNNTHLLFSGSPNLLSELEPITNSTYIKSPSDFETFLKDFT